MSEIAQLEPSDVFTYFEQISRIPRGSGNIWHISNFLTEFARERGLFCRQDEWGNVLIIKDPTPGYEDEPAIILQGHMDMVAVKSPDCTKDMEKEGLTLAVDGDALYAQGTSLGGDDGIAVAYCMAILASDVLKHPRLEVLLTVDEETGMDGARAMDISLLEGRQMLNLDSEEEGIFLTGCAGGARVKCKLAFDHSKRKGALCKIAVTGLQGGHSGAEIHKERGNANLLLGRLLKEISKRAQVCLVAADGGVADNAIPSSAEMTLLLEDAAQIAQVWEACDGLGEILRAELAVRDAGVSLVYSCEEETAQRDCIGAKDTERIADVLLSLSNGVQGMSMEVEGLVETSLNLGILKVGEGDFLAEFAVRSSVESRKAELIERVLSVMALAGGSCEVSGSYPGWQYRSVSPLRDRMAALYQNMYGKAPKIEAIHAGVECGFFVDKIPGLDCVSIGPDMQDIHTANERLSISSTRRVWEFVTALLEKKTQ